MRDRIIDDSATFPASFRGRMPTHTSSKEDEPNCTKLAEDIGQFNDA